MFLKSHPHTPHLPSPTVVGLWTPNHPWDLWIPGGDCWGPAHSRNLSLELFCFCCVVPHFIAGSEFLRACYIWGMAQGSNLKLGTVDPLSCVALFPLLAGSGSEPAVSGEQHKEASPLKLFVFTNLFPHLHHPPPRPPSPAPFMLPLTASPSVPDCSVYICTTTI